MKRQVLIVPAVMIVLGLTPGRQLVAQQRSNVVDDAALTDEIQGDDCRAFGRTYSEQRFSPLVQVNKSNISNLAVDWFLELPNDRGLVSTPLVVDGVMYFIGSMNIVRAVDATSGRLLWEYDPLVREYADRRLR
ncbi:uncharacterized protein METZ01_LOCUS171668, partial [marine metagenome]